MRNFCFLAALITTLGAGSIAPPAYAASQIPRSPSSVGRFDWSMARKLFRRLHPKSGPEVGRALKDAHARNDYRAIAENAAELCTLGDRNGSCRDAERFGGHLSRRVVFVRQ